MRRFLKWFGIIAGGLLGVFLVLLVVLFFVGSQKVNRTYDVQLAPVAVPTDAASIARGKHYAEAVGVCQVCHGQDLAGPVVAECKDVPCTGFSDDPVFGKLMPTNLTSGRGGIGGVFTDDDYVRAIRHGISRDNKSLLIMPSEQYNKISDEDLGAMIAYLKTIDPVDNELDESNLGPLGRIIAVIAGGLLPASQIDHSAARAPSPVVGVSAEYGGYLAEACTICHGDQLTGSKVPGNERVDAPNITLGGAPGDWTKSQFVTTLRSGMTPRGDLLDPRFMPWNRFNQMTDDELDAIWLYLQSLPAG
ncbi:MAG: c-type cytochrome [Chloroflexi bacterium]|nr:c-type cytochrome [Chloroflexota bacterium]